MMLKRPASERGHADHGWLKAFHTFSFANYHDPEHMGFRTLRVINDDTIAPGRGFGTHGHRDMEIITYVLDGALEHKDSLGTGSVLRHGDVQRMSAGHGVRHSEFNHSQDEELRLLQIWLLPAQLGIDPGYEEKHFPRGEKRNRLRLIASPDARDGSLKIHQDVLVHAGELEEGKSLTYTPQPGRHLWLQVARGRLLANGVELERGDGLAVSEESELTLEGLDSAEFLLFDLN
jgi:redox-sensitive bicupin YhaK (pirin superfamily)